jgi:transposase InsO family protein
VGRGHITYVRTWEGWLYLSFVLDTYSRKVVGWSMANHLRAELVLDALNMAIYTRRPQNPGSFIIPTVAASTPPWSSAEPPEKSGSLALDGICGRRLRQLDG